MPIPAPAPADSVFEDDDEVSSCEADGPEVDVAVTVVDVAVSEVVFSVKALAVVPAADVAT